MARLVLEKLTKDYGNVRAVNSLSLEVDDGEFLVILGPSGAGKTTTLKLIAGVETPTSGKIYMDGKLMNAVEPHKRNVAMAFESYALYPHFSVKENIAFPLRAPGRNLAANEIAKRVERVAALLNITPLLDRKPKMLSNGQRQRVALGRAMVRDSEVLLLDEPISHLDAKLRHRMRTEFKALESMITSTTIYVTHDYLEAMSLGDRLVVLDRGEIQQIGKPHELFANPVNTFVAKILGHPQINLIDCGIEGGQFVSGDGTVRIDIPDRLRANVNRLNLDRVTVGIRPLHVGVLNGHTPTGAVANGSVYVYERLGTKGVLSALVGGQKIDILTPIEADYAIDQAVRIDIDRDQIIAFDPRTGRNITFA
jgi:multiple sugar transport system ATP-binding protein